MTMSPEIDEANKVQSVPLNRREFLYILWGSSMAVFMTGSGGALLWFTLPRFRAGEFGGVFTLSLDAIPSPDSEPMEFAGGGYWLVNIGSKTRSDQRQPDDYPLDFGIRALFKVCTHLGCIYKWVGINERFECPCHGSKYLTSGARIDGPARRNLDVFMIEILNEKGKVLAQTEPTIKTKEGTAIEIPEGAVTLRIDTGRRILGGPNSKPGGGI